MHRATPLNAIFRAYCAGGSRSVVKTIDDTKLMQNMTGNIMQNESRDQIEAPQNYGFTSVVFDAEQAMEGMGGGGGMGGAGMLGAEVVHNFLGGNRTYPVAGNMDDRRHRLFKLLQGDTAMFRGRGDKQQFHMTQDGGFWTGPQDKTLRMQLVQQDSESNSTQQSGGGQASAAAFRRKPQQGDIMPDGKRLPKPTLLDSGGGNGGSGGQQSQENKGQEALYKDGQKSPMFVDVTRNASRVSGQEVHLMLSDGNLYVHVVGNEVYLGGKKGSGTFGRVATDKGYSINVYAKVG
jgi:hypothetical protein